MLSIVSHLLLIGLLATTHLGQTGATEPQIKNCDSTAFNYLENCKKHIAIHIYYKAGAVSDDFTALEYGEFIDTFVNRDKFNTIMVPILQKIAPYWTSPSGTVLGECITRVTQAVCLIGAPPCLTNNRIFRTPCSYCQALYDPDGAHIQILMSK